MIRKYRIQDLEDLLSAWAAASEVAHPFVIREFLASERENIPKVYLPKAETWVSEIDGSVVGFVSLLGSEVGALFVHPDYHRRGIGRSLMDKAREQRGDLEVDVFTANKIGRSFYAKYGFQPVEKKVDEQTGLEVMRLRLTTVKSPPSTTPYGG